MDQLSPQVSPGGTRTATEALSTAADMRGDPQDRLPITSAVLLHSVRRLLCVRGKVKGTMLQWSVGGVLISRTLAFEPVGG